MRTLEQDLRAEKLRIDDLHKRAARRLDECRTEATALQTKGAAAAGAGDTDGAAGIERRAQKLRARGRRYEEVVHELEAGGDGLAAEVLLARLQGPDVDVLLGEVERNRELVLQECVALLRARDNHKSLRQRWGELNEKIRTLRRLRGLPPVAPSRVELRIHVTPAEFAQKPEGPTHRELADLVQHLGL
jgi:hypothetical protein